jgi:hypothetical protein
MKKVLAISSVLLGVVFLAGCGQQPISQTQPTPVPVVQQPTQPIATPMTPTQSQPIQDASYTNAKYGFGLTLPDRWKDYKTKEVGNSITFSLKLTTPIVSDDGIKQEYGDIFIIIAFSPADWTKNQKANDPSVSNYIARNNNYVFGYIMGQDDEGYVGFHEVVPNMIYQGPFYDVRNTIIPSFKFTK